jgi:hypothetical protein
MLSEEISTMSKKQMYRRSTPNILIKESHKMKNYYIYESAGGKHLIRVESDGSKAYSPKLIPSMRLKEYDIVKVVSQEKVNGIELLVNLAIQPKEILRFPSDESALLWFKLEH